MTFENAGPDAFYEAAHPGRPSWSEVGVTGLFPSPFDAGRVVSAVRSRFGRSLTAEVAQLEHRDWENCWLEHFRPNRVGEHLWICPTWSTPPVADAVNLMLDPGLAFGTGTHPTTSMCLAWLDRHRPLGKRVVDYGCGSGILAIASLMLGARQAWAVDVDARALTASQRNAERNGVSGRLIVCSDADLPGDMRAELVMANILAGVLIDLRSRLTSMLDQGGVILLTGILQGQEAEVREAYGPEFSFERTAAEEWLMLIGHRS